LSGFPIRVRAKATRRKHPVALRPDLSQERVDAPKQTTKEKKTEGKTKETTVLPYSSCRRYEVGAWEETVVVPTATQLLGTQHRHQHRSETQRLKSPRLLTDTSICGNLDFTGVTMSVGATEPTETAPVVAAEAGQSESSPLRELVGDQEVEMGDGSGRKLSELESSVVGGMEMEEELGRPKFRRAVPGAGQQQSTQNFFQRGNYHRLGNGSRDNDDIFATPSKQTPRRGPPDNIDQPCDRCPLALLRPRR